MGLGFARSCWGHEAAQKRAHYKERLHMERRNSVKRSGRNFAAVDHRSEPTPFSGQHYAQYARGHSEMLERFLQTVVPRLA